MAIGRGAGLRILMHAGLLAIDLAITEMVLGQECSELHGSRKQRRMSYLVKPLMHHHGILD